MLLSLKPAESSTKPTGHIFTWLGIFTLFKLVNYISMAFLGSAAQTLCRSILMPSLHKNNIRQVFHVTWLSIKLYVDYRPETLLTVILMQNCYLKHFSQHHKSYIKGFIGWLIIKEQLPVDKLFLFYNITVCTAIMFYFACQILKKKQSLSEVKTQKAITMKHNHSGNMHLKQSITENLPRF